MPRKRTIKGRLCQFCGSSELLKISGRNPIVSVRCKSCNKISKLSDTNYEKNLIFPSRHIASRSKTPSFVFQCGAHGLYEAYIPNQFEQAVMTDICQNTDGTWSWNCYDIGKFSSRSELVRRFLYINSTIGLVDYVNNDMQKIFEGIEDV